MVQLPLPVPTPTSCCAFSPGTSYKAATLKQRMYDDDKHGSNKNGLRKTLETYEPIRLAICLSLTPCTHPDSIDGRRSIQVCGSCRTNNVRSDQYTISSTNPQPKPSKVSICCSISRSINPISQSTRPKTSRQTYSLPHEHARALLQSQFLTSPFHDTQVELPPDIHPLPESVNAYVRTYSSHRRSFSYARPFQFVYPFTLEPHVLTVESNRRATLAVHAARHEALLRAREDEKQRRKREALRRIAPGFEPRAAPLVPVKTGMALDQYQPQQEGDNGAAAGQGGHLRDVMDDLVDRLAALESAADR